MKVQYPNPGRKGPARRPEKENLRLLSLRLLAAVAIFLGILGAKSWLPGASAPAMAALEGSLRANADLAAVTRALGQAAAGDRDFTAVFRSLFLTGEVRGEQPVDPAHLRAESRFLSMEHSGQELLRHYLPGGNPEGCWLDSEGTGGEAGEA